MDARLYYREATITGASPVELVIRLYEQIIEDLRQAIRALEQKNIELRTAKINHATLVIAYLESQLNLAEGGVGAENLRDFYRALRANLTAAQFRQSKDILLQQITDILAVREAWLALRNADQGGEYASDRRQQPPAFADSSPATARSGWSG